MQFFRVARGSLYELETQLYPGFVQQYLTEGNLQEKLE
jgi:hypothetical protein